MDPLQIKRLKEEHEKGLYFCKEKIKKWENFQADYEALKQRLETLPDSLSYDVTVPFGSNAFTKGKIVHTNEIMVLLGDNWFVEVSAKQAVAIATRRITHCTNMLEDLKKEMQQYENWLNYIGEVSGSEELIEIVEDYDEERESKWKEQHAKNVKSYRKQLAEKGKDFTEIDDSDEDYLRRLDELELADVNGIDISDEDSSKSELNSKEVESYNSTVDCSDAQSQPEEHPKRPPLKLHINCNSRKTSESETGEDYEDNHNRKTSESETGEDYEDNHKRKTSESETGEDYEDNHKRKTSESETGEDYEDNHKRKTSESETGEDYEDNRKRKTSESETGDDYEECRRRDWNDNSVQEGTSPKNGKHVRWQDLSKQNIKKITFKHSKPKKPNTPSSKYKGIDSNEDENHPLIQSPSDIYKHFGGFFQSSPPKSILKVKSPSPSTEMNGPIFPTKDTVSKESSETDESITSQPFTNEVHERSSPINIVEPKSSRPTSHFKSSRKNRKR